MASQKVHRKIVFFNYSFIEKNQNDIKNPRKSSTAFSRKSPFEKGGPTCVFPWISLLSIDLSRSTCSTFKNIVLGQNLQV